MGNKFICENCGKEVDCGEKNPNNWKQKLCYDCRKKLTGGVVSTAKATSATKYQPTKAFNLETYINDLLDVYQALTYACQGRDVVIPEQSLCQWATSIMIQREKING